MKVLKLYIYVAIISLFQSCDEYIDVQPRGIKIITDLEDVNAILKNVEKFIQGNSTTYALYFNDNVMMDDALVTEMLTRKFGAYGMSLASAYTFQDKFISPERLDFVWEYNYDIVGYCNHVLESLKNIEVEGDLIATKNDYIAEAKVHRAYSLFVLVNTYGQHYGTSIAYQKDSGVPIVTTFADFTVDIFRKSVNEVYDFIESELSESFNLIGSNTKDNYRPTKASIYAIQAKLYLHKGDYPKALTKVNMALELKSDLIDYNSDLVGGLLPQSLTNPEVYLLKEEKIAAVGPLSNRIILTRFSNELIAKYDQVNDLRFSLLTAHPDGYYTYGDGGTNRRLRLVSGPTVPEIMLIKAEAMARTGVAPATVIAEVNKLRAKRYITGTVYKLTAANQAEAIQHILDEKRRELPMNGSRFFDIKRLNALENANITLSRPGTSLTLTPNHPKWACPIGDDVINTSNGMIIQNPRN